VRLSLAEAATAARGRAQVLSTWPLTRGRILRLLVANIVIATPIVAAAFCPVAGWPGAVARGVAFGGLWLPLGVGLMAYAYDAEGAR
jgi:hypothetical protein